MLITALYGEEVTLGKEDFIITYTIVMRNTSQFYKYMTRCNLLSSSILSS